MRMIFFLRNIQMGKEREVERREKIGRLIARIRCSWRLSCNEKMMIGLLNVGR